MTGVEALQKILDVVEGLQKQINGIDTSIKMIEANIKVLNNRAAGVMRDSLSSIISADVPLQAQIPVQSQPQAQTLQAGPPRGRQLIEQPQQDMHMPEDRPGVLTYKKVFGKLISATSESIESVLVKIYDKNNEVCATAETDPIGYWEMMLKPGRYVAEYTKTGFKTANKTFEIGKNVKEYEVK